MGNRSSANSVRVVHADGQVQELRTSVLAAELVAHDPNFLVCQSTSLRVGKRPCPLHPDTELELGNLYFILPIRAFQSRIAWSHISFLAGKAFPKSRKLTEGKLKRKPAAKMAPVPQSYSAPFRLVLKADTLQITATLQYLRRLREERLLESVPTVSKLNVGVTPEMRTRYIYQLIDRCNSWRPKLDTIQESSNERKPNVLRDTCEHKSGRFLSLEHKS